MNQKLLGLLDESQIDYPIKGEWRPCVVRTFVNGIELELWKLYEHKNSIVIKKKIKSFDFSDMILMNDTLNKIYGR